MHMENKKVVFLTFSPKSDLMMDLMIEIKESKFVPLLNLCFFKIEAILTCDVTELLLLLSVSIPYLTHTHRLQGGRGRGSESCSWSQLPAFSRCCPPPSLILLLSAANECGLLLPPSPPPPPRPPTRVVTIQSVQHLQT